MKRYFVMPAIGKKATFRQYVQAWRTAKANPTTLYKRGLTTPWPCTGAEILQQFRDALHQRISQAIPYSKRGRPDV